MKFDGTLLVTKRGCGLIFFV